MYSIVFTKKAVRDIPKLKSVKPDSTVRALMEIIRNDPYQTPSPHEKLRDDLKGACSRRINLKHRLAYKVLEAEQTIKIISLWT